MAIVSKREISLQDIRADGVVGTSKANVLGPTQGWQGNVLRLFRINAGGNTPHHQHDWEHINYVTRGKGLLTINGETQEIAQGDFALVPPNTMHQFRNPFDSDFEFICIVPERGAY
jgi:quercetin dioxygenase-like cupin family protein